MSQLEQIEVKCVDWTTALQRVESWKSAGESIVFTNGCFDILHKGHVTYLAKAADLGSRLVVGLNDDASVRSLEKGSERPINDEQARSMVLASLACVDLVVIFNQSTPLELIEHLLPSVLVKGGDYDPNETNKNAKSYIVGSDIVRNHRGSVVTIDLVDGFSTTSILKKSKGQ
jgi:rfaE bifunctional protein nucleotidyltransferase chain/domain